MVRGKSVLSMFVLLYTFIECGVNLLLPKNDCCVWICKCVQAKECQSIEVADLRDPFLSFRSSGSMLFCLMTDDSAVWMVCQQQEAQNLPIYGSRTM
jgi:hypothetical protein